MLSLLNLTLPLRSGQGSHHYPPFIDGETGSGKSSRLLKFTEPSVFSWGHLPCLARGLLPHHDCISAPRNFQYSGHWTLEGPPQGQIRPSAFPPVAALVGKAPELGFPSQAHALGDLPVP